ncbi:hypothetical protein LSAT2_005446 [Lamellibrachia satsuma]|nr:hypothetical protein LSAT2_005446 [Lamellibrachia satsuma]
MDHGPWTMLNSIPMIHQYYLVRHFLEVTLTDLRNKWIQHLSYKTCVQCYCGWLCETHNAVQCSHDQCLHFLNLDECISNKIVCCEHRRVKTSRYRKWFQAPVPLFKKGPILDAAVLKGVEATQGNIESRHGPQLPSWVKSIAKLLNGGSEGQDWTALAFNLGYTKAKLEKFNEDLNPSLAMVTDWIISSGNTPLSVDMLVSSLELMQRDDIVEVIQRGRESEVEPAQVFISYQWDIQDEVRALRNKLETAGFTCWMDVGQMGGGDQLYGKIDTAIRGCKVAIACITPKYIVSQLCMKEVGLADLLRKPIIPILYSNVPWPPPGGMALTFSQLVYININGVGGHGGSGIHADLADKYQEIVQRVSCFATTLPLDIPDSSPLPCNVSEQSMRSASLHSASSQPEAILIEGYTSDYSAPSNRVTLPSLQRTAPSSAHSREVPVEQVHITKCTVCVIL